MTEQSAPLTLDERDRPATQISAEMAEAGRLALIEWYEGAADFADGAVSIFRTMCAAGQIDKIAQ